MVFHGKNQAPWDYTDKRGTRIIKKFCGGSSLQASADGRSIHRAELLILMEVQP
jgi:hypothetical protein